MENFKPSMYCGASSHHIHCENFEFKTDEKLLVFGRDEVDNKSTWLDLNNCTDKIGKSRKTKNCDNVPFFSFPKDKARAVVWLLKCGIQESTIDKLDIYKICGAHFENNFFKNHLKSRLYPDAVPKIFLTLEGSSKESQNEHNYDQNVLNP
ncbi:uncharacterized protein [Diabrotica undecimpunctata]|uniref:uncharacterized protein isoform X1 n=1 Tax=Diabrotica undecimpunctata TaxID=50387 RepID=UPI003B63DAC5